tara:strand:- start:383 stop:565 length:183 start_codon:yes stop_codon:yes gene_type:complete
MIILTRGQQVALWTKWQQDNQGVSYRQFRKTVVPEMCSDAVMVQWSGMWLGIEADGYTHS